MNYLTSIKAAWHKKNQKIKKNQRKFDICICIKFESNTILLSIVNSQKSYHTNRTVRPSAVQIKKIVLYVRV